MSVQNVLRSVALLAAVLMMVSSFAQTSPTTGPTVAPPNIQPPSTSGVKLDAEEARVRLLLSAHDSFPTKDELLAISEAAPAILMRLAQSDTELPTTRHRAIDGLGYFADVEVADFLSNLLDNQNQLDEMAVHKSITALMKTQGEKGLEVVSPYLEHSDLQLRLTAVNAVGKFGGRGGQVLLEERSKVEPSKVVLEKIQNFL